MILGILNSSLFSSGATALHGYHTDDDIAYLLANI